MNTIFNSITVVFALGGTATGITVAADGDGKQRKDEHWRDDPGGMAKIDDAAVTAAIRSKLAGPRDEADLATYVEARRGRVTLLGTARSTAASRRAESMAQNTRGVVYVDNQLIVTDMTPYQVEIAPLSPIAFAEPTGAEMMAGFVPPIQITTPGAYGTGSQTTVSTARTSMGSRASGAVPASTLGGPEISAVRCEGNNPTVPGSGMDDAIAR